MSSTAKMTLLIVLRFDLYQAKVQRKIIKTDKNETVIGVIMRSFVLRDLVFYPYFQGFVESRSLLVVYVFTSPDSPRGPPWNEGHRPKVRHETSVLEVPAQEQREHSFCSSTTNTFISYSLYTVHRYRTSPGAPDLRVRLG